MSGTSRRRFELGELLLLGVEDVDAHQSAGKLLHVLLGHRSKQLATAGQASNNKLQLLALPQLLQPLSNRAFRPLLHGGGVITN